MDAQRAVTALDELVQRRDDLEVDLLVFLVGDKYVVLQEGRNCRLRIGPVPILEHLCLVGLVVPTRRIYAVHQHSQTIPAGRHEPSNCWRLGGDPSLRLWIRSYRMIPLHPRKMNGNPCCKVMINLVSSSSLRPPLCH
ncbi:unnamed protein product [Prorocentrum cordatum]|uniref:Uncharacterized protein n=1 Tax=Prorocentrum cordatum TaxID=2364126 RepID=A0ABN9XJS7_9DINO|nr:unnamed protein product [Polarella glacialis]